MGFRRAGFSFIESNDLSMGSHKIVSLGTPTANTDASTKAYVDASIGGGGIGGNGTANTIAKFNGGTATLGDSAITDDAAAKLIVASRRMEVSTTFDGTSDQHAALEVNSNGVALTSKDGGVQSFQASTYDTTASAAQSIAVYAGNTASISAGANVLNNYAVYASCSGGTNNYSFYGQSGYLHNTEGAFLGTTTDGVTIGTGSTAAADNLQINVPLTVLNTQAVSLGNTVQSFKVAGTGCFVDIGYTGTPNGQIATKNTDAGSTFGGVEVHLDTTVNASARGGYWLYRGAGNGNELGGMVVPDAADTFATGAAANDVVIYNYDPSSLGQSVCIATGSTPTVRIEVQTSGQTDIKAGLKVTGNLGFYGTAPIAQQTGVAVSAAGIHAALVNLGLITA